MSESGTLTNGEVARVFERIAGIMEIQGENAFKIRAYRNAVETLNTLPEPIAQVAAAGRLDDIPGFGEAIQAKVKDILATGTTALYERIKDKVPAGVVEMLSIPGLGAKTVRQVWEGLKIESIAALETAAQSGKLTELPGMGEKTVQKILQSIERYRRYSGRIRIGDALPLAESLISAIQNFPGVSEAHIAGSVARGRETVANINLAAAATSPAEALQGFTQLPQVSSIVSQDERSALVVLHGGMEADLFVAAPDEFAELLDERIGSAAYNEARRAQTEVSADLLKRVPMEIRENGGEIEAALAGTLPTLVTLADIRGDVHAHTTASDGKVTIQQMAVAAKAHGYEYMAITDHSQSLYIANGLTPDRLRAQIAEIRALEDSLGIRIFTGSEVDIKADGTMDFDDDLLQELDIVIASAHMHNNQDKDTQTKRIIKAIENPNVDLIAHPSGRIINRRDPFDFDFDAVVAAALRTDTALEINAAPERLDMSDVHARQAGAAGVKILINTDAHSIENYDLMRYGVLVARRAWLTPHNVFNTRPLAEFEAWLRR
ncbi:MAG: helix-hairpin-helix domain-containing protein [Capsulimonas sp.]|uniref:helix-hairpin-helix domain-containing protein n=1 Tax=Capsulimonas sp. TaxID=2494211 RepID=UPI0032662254